MNFEKKLGDLEKIVSAMESGELSLDDSLKKFEQGVKLTRECQEALEKAELKVQQLVSISAEGEAQTEDFDEE
ncbi:MAG: exodeoxyribonuclease VII small subunit [Bdellovibrionaceae bacterium]|nr:exodeoxyribonuclease VII small subunit [Pseudobdellovibrionaceae bacterium]|tara:strand:- start:601 stop:819 length:219 start_codon:yes stop_codon:yes gene_type:complete